MELERSSITGPGDWSGHSPASNHGRLAEAEEPREGWIQCAKAMKPICLAVLRRLTREVLVFIDMERCHSVPVTNSEPLIAFALESTLRGTRLS